MNGELESVRPDILIKRDPKKVLEEAKLAAQALMSVVSLKKKPVIFNNEQYLEFEDWQTVGKFYGLTAKVMTTLFVDFGGAKGFEAGADVIDSDGRVLSHADAMCLNDEENWSTRPKYEYKDVLDEGGKKIWVEGKGDKKGYYKSEKIKIADVPVPFFQLRSMAQTRACAKALRNVLAWVVVLAGYAPTPAEEMTGDEPQQAASPIKKPQPNLNTADFKPLKSKFAGSCKACEGPVKVGDEVMYNPKLKGVYHPNCLSPKTQEPPIVTQVMSKGILENLEKMAKACKTNLIDRIGRDGLDNVELITIEYAQELLAEFASILDQEK